MAETRVLELKRRSVAKSLLWRFIGIIWTWTGAYLIILFAPAEYRTAGFLATFIVIYHHSTRMIMYYFYERIWARVGWGKINADKEDKAAMSFFDKVIWVTVVVAILILLFLLIIFVGPMMKK
ncbi:MAG: hypothetical protein ISS79_04380 [Phycisphaerae bacterium]|nr:hypothetical protein [Phycisphaerae bacterium]